MIVEDEPIIRMALADHLEKQGFEVTEAGSGDRAMELIKETPFDLVVTDVQMPGWNDGIALALWVRKNHPRTRIIIVSGATSGSPELVALGQEGVVLPKPYAVEELALRAVMLLQEIR